MSPSESFARSSAFFPRLNVWGEAKDKEFRAIGHPAGAKQSRAAAGAGRGGA